ncbi:MAG: hypothetical protein ACI9UA_006237 [Pseudoalteromonas tetraodonis]|jgi:hypothetical protein
MTSIQLVAAIVFFGCSGLCFAEPVAFIENRRNAYAPLSEAASETIYLPEAIDVFTFTFLYHCRHSGWLDLGYIRNDAARVQVIRANDGIVLRERSWTEPATEHYQNEHLRNQCRRTLVLPLVPQARQQKLPDEQW